MRSDHPFPATVAMVNEGIKRLRDAEGDSLVTLWRGIKNMKVALDFLRAGGVEMAPMRSLYIYIHICIYDVMYACIYVFICIYIYVCVYI